MDGRVQKTERRINPLWSFRPSRPKPDWNRNHPKVGEQTHPSWLRSGRVSDLVDERPREFRIQNKQDPVRSDVQRHRDGLRHRSFPRFSFLRCLFPRRFFPRRRARCATNRLDCSDCSDRSDPIVRLPYRVTALQLDSFQIHFEDGDRLPARSEEYSGFGITAFGDVM